MSFSDQGLDHDLHYTCIATCQQNHSGFKNETQNTASPFYLFSAFSLKAFLDPLIMRKGKKSEPDSYEERYYCFPMLDWPASLQAVTALLQQWVGSNISKGADAPASLLPRHCSQQTQYSFWSYSLALILSFIFSSSCNTGPLSGNQLYSP